MKLAKLKTVKALNAKVLKLISGGHKELSSKKKDVESRSDDSMDND